MKTYQSENFVLLTDTSNRIATYVLTTAEEAFDDFYYWLEIHKRPTQKPSSKNLLIYFARRKDLKEFNNGHAAHASHAAYYDLGKDWVVLANQLDRPNHQNPKLQRQYADFDYDTIRHEVIHALSFDPAC